MIIAANTTEAPPPAQRSPLHIWAARAVGDPIRALRVLRGIDLMWLMAASARLLVVRLLLLSLSSAVSSARGKHSSRKLEELLDLTTIPGLSFRAPQVETVPGVQLWWPQYLQSPLAPRTDLAAIENQLAIAYIAIGNEVTHEMLLPLSISTVRRAGGFRGDVFVITDRPD
eukprot:6187879-Pleurochrysis_carterae.AAC.1